MPDPTKPAIVLVPGFWCPPTAYDHVITHLHAHGYATYVAPLASTGKRSSKSPRSPSIHDDIAGVRAVLSPLVEAGQSVILVLHSAGGFVGAAAIEGLSEGTRLERRLVGGVRKVVALAAATQYTGYDHPFFVIENNEMHCKSPRDTLFNDVTSDKDAEALVALLRCQPGSGYSGSSTYAGWKDVPSVYLVTEEDEVLLAPLQEQLAEMIGAEVKTCDAGHMVHMTQPQTVAETIIEAAQS